MCHMSDVTFCDGETCWMQDKFQKDFISDNKVINQSIDQWRSMDESMNQWRDTEHHGAWVGACCIRYE